MGAGAHRSGRVLAVIITITLAENTVNVQRLSSELEQDCAIRTTHSQSRIRMNTLCYPYDS